MTPQEQAYCEIPLTQGQVAKVSPHRFAELNKYKWSAVWNPGTRSFYAFRREPQVRNVQGPQVYMHRQVFGLTRGDKRTVDHINIDTLDNRDENLRIATRSQQLCNQRRRRDNTSGYKGVCFDLKSGRWRAYIRPGGKQKHLGYFSTPQEAHVAYCAAARSIFGEFARGA